MKTISFTEYIKQNYENDIYNRVSSFVYSHKNQIDWKSATIDEPGWIEVQDVAIKLVYPVNKPGMQIEFYVHTLANVALQKGSNRDDTTDDFVNPWFTVKCSGIIGDSSLEKFRIIEVAEYKSLKGTRGHMTDNLVQYLRKEDYDHEAQDFLHEYGLDNYYRNPTRIDPIHVINAMGMKYRELPLADDKSVLGRVYMYDCDAPVYNWESSKYETPHIDAGTLVIDPYADAEMPEGARNNTLIHECYHWYAHRKAFALFKMCNPDICNIEYTREFDAVDESDAVNWMERQARAMAPRILLPSVAFKAKTEELIKTAKDLEPDKTYVEWLQFVIDELARFFHVSTISVQIRLIEMGYTQAIGINNWVDGHWVPPHGVFRREAIKPTQTFTVSDSDAMYQSVADPKLACLLETGQYIFAENHFVINSDTYVAVSETGHLFLTPYARTHMEECALIFDRAILNGKRYDDDAILFCALNKNSIFGIRMEAKLACAPHEISKEEMQKYREYKAEIDEVVSGMTSRFKDRVKGAIKYSELTQESIGLNCDLSRQTVSEYANSDDPKISEDSLLQLCIGLNAPYEICKALFEKAPCQIVNPQKRIVYDTIMKIMTFRTIAECNRFLKNNGLEPIGEHKYLEDVYQKEIK